MKTTAMKYVLVQTDIDGYSQDYFIHFSMS